MVHPWLPRARVAVQPQGCGAALDQGFARCGQLDRGEGPEPLGDVERGLGPEPVAKGEHSVGEGELPDEGGQSGNGIGGGDVDPEQGAAGGVFGRQYLGRGFPGGPLDGAVQQRDAVPLGSGAQDVVAVGAEVLPVVEARAQLGRQRFTVHGHDEAAQVVVVVGLLVVTALQVRAGANAPAVNLASGWYAGGIGWFGPHQYGQRPALLARGSCVWRTAARSSPSAPARIASPPERRPVHGRGGGTPRCSPPLPGQRVTPSAGSTVSATR